MVFEEVNIPGTHLNRVSFIQLECAESTLKNATQNWMFEFVRQIVKLLRLSEFCLSLWKVLLSF